jgi:hypothetical protein
MVNPLSIGSMLLLENSDELPKGLYVGRATVLSEGTARSPCLNAHSSLKRLPSLHPLVKKAVNRCKNGFMVVEAI